MGNSGGVYIWSKTAANNAGADNTVNWQEGQAPSSINDSARSMMASIAKYRDDISGAIVTTGTAQNYTVASNQQFDSLADFAGQVIAFTPHATNTGSPVTMTVDGFANLPVRSAPNAELLPGVLIAGTPYVALYNKADGALYLQGFFGNPYNIPIGAGIDYWGSTAPNGSFAFPIGQAISRTIYATLFSLFGTTYGAGDGATTFNIPDKRGRVSVAADSGTGRMPGYSLGVSGGAATHTLTLAELPSDIQSVQNQGFNISVTSTRSDIDVGTGGSSTGGGGIPVTTPGSTAQITSVGTVNAGNVTTSSTNTGGGAHTIVQPSIACNYIMRII